VTAAIHVAVLDDEPSIRTALIRLLTAAGMAVVTYETASQFFNAVGIKVPDCLVLDFQMPGMSGLEVLKELNQRGIRIPTIIITGHDDKTARDACIEAGAAACQLKPLDAEQLIGTIRTIGAKP
jgi:FixJ family two-component response regulator